MSRISIMLLVGTVGIAAPGPKGKVAEHYFPTTEGATKVFAATFGDEVNEIVETVSKVEKRDGAVRVTVSRKYSKAPPESLITEVSEAGVFTVRNETEELAEPVPLLKLGLKPGDSGTWEKKLTTGAVDVSGKYTMGKEEEIEVPAGKFRAVRVDSRLEVKSRVIVSSHWYAPGVGLVKMVSTSAGLERTQTLKSFTKGK